jgi:hypothetical protein
VGCWNYILNHRSYASGMPNAEGCLGRGVKEHALRALRDSDAMPEHCSARCRKFAFDASAIAKQRM